MHPSERIIWDLIRTSLNDMILISPKLLGSLTQLWGKHSILYTKGLPHSGNFEHFKPTKDHLASAILSHRPLPLFLLWCHSSLLSRRVPWFHQWNSKGQLLRRHLHFHLALVTTHHWSHHPCGPMDIYGPKSLLDASWTPKYTKIALPVPASSASAPCFRFFSLCFFSCFPRTHLAQTIRATLGDPIECKACTRVSAKGTVLLVFLILFACFVLLVLFVVVLRILFLLLLLCLVTLLLCLLVCFFCSVRLFAPWFKTKPEVRKPLHNLCFLCFFYRGLSQEKWICWIFAGLSSLPTHNQNHLTETNVSHDTSFQAPFPPFKIGKCGLPTRWT